MKAVRITVSLVLASILICDKINYVRAFVHWPKQLVLYQSTTELHSALRHGDRRELLQSIARVGLLSTPSLLINPRSVSASELLPKQPFAPNETLLPAVRVKLSIDRAIALLSDSSSSKDVANSVVTLRELENTFLKPQNYVGSLKLQGVPAKPADKYLESYKPMKGDLPFQRYLIKSGDVDTWKRLKKREKQQEREDEVRAALNAYTDALSFSSDSYRLNVDKATQKSMVREDRLPDVRQVITSDMGMRYLYRNQILTAMDDIRAELKYQLSPYDNSNGAAVERTAVVADATTSINNGWSSTELLDLLLSAQKAFDRWFGLIDPNDVQIAFDTVKIEK